MKTKKPYEIIIQADFGPKNVKVKSVDVARSSNKKIDTLIQSEWERLTDETEKKGGKLHNGKLYRLISIHRDKSEPEGLVLTLGPTTYREFVGTNLAQIRCCGHYSSKFFANPLGTSALVITNDNKVLLGQRGTQVFYHRGYSHAFGGLVEEADRTAEGGIDIFSSIRRELNEELGLGEPDIRNIKQPELLFEAACNLSCAEIEVRWKNALSHKEHTQLISIEDNPNSISDFLGQTGPIAPVAVAALHFRANRCKNAS